MMELRNAELKKQTNNNIKHKNKNKNKNNQIEEELSHDISLTSSQENAILSIPPPPLSPIFQTNPNESETQLSLSILKEEIDLLKIAFNKLKEEKDEEIAKLKEEKDTEIAYLKSKVLALENDRTESVSPTGTELEAIRNTVQNIAESQETLQQEQVKNTCVITGALPVGSQNEDCKDTLTKVIESKLKIKLNPNAVTEVFRLGKLKTEEGIQDKRPISFKIKEEGLKSKLVRSAIENKPDVYINEFLIQKNKDLLKRALTIRRDHRNLIHSCYFRNGLLHIKKSERSSTITIKNNDELNIYLNNSAV